MNEGKRCRECGGSMLAIKRSEGVFCAPECKRLFSNRRAVRGAEIYDLFMTLRYDRELAKRLGVFRLMCRLGQQYRKEDSERRHGFVSWLDPELVIARKPWLNAALSRS